MLSLFFFNATAPTQIYTLSLHDALPISLAAGDPDLLSHQIHVADHLRHWMLDLQTGIHRSEEHTSELQSRLHLVCRLLLEKKKKQKQNNIHIENITLLIILVRLL